MLMSLPLKIIFIYSVDPGFNLSISPPLLSVPLTQIFPHFLLPPFVWGGEGLPGYKPTHKSLITRCILSHWGGRVSPFRGTESTGRHQAPGTVVRGPAGKPSTESLGPACVCSLVVQVIDSIGLPVGSLCPPGFSILLPTLHMTPRAHPSSIPIIIGSGLFIVPIYHDVLC